ncbi:MAG TPA: hypothetical protein VNN74_11070 [Candidatus Micrarchaeia archaeon]|nr:hypothetical protein [Candidatus Micrarchaeia archaeon]
MGRRNQQSVSRIGTTASQLADLVGPRIRAATGSLGPALESARQQLPQVAEARERVGEAIGDAFDEARERSGALAEQVVQAAYEVSKSLPPDARRMVESSLRKTGVEPPRPKRHRGRRRAWIAAGILAGAGVAFLFSGTLQDKVYDVVDRLQGRTGDDDDDEWSTGPLAAPEAEDGQGAETSAAGGDSDRGAPD